MKHKNQAFPITTSDDKMICKDGASDVEKDASNEPISFLMKDSEHEFTLGLSTVLDCLAIAEQEGYVPELPGKWWNAIADYC